ncbi:MAG TPA: hypothetical protein VMW01_09300 [Williamwhitmania sp.]|nr:hypothetical protein [Williamwhitmania sp.]
MMRSSRSAGRAVRLLRTFANGRKAGGWPYGVVAAAGPGVHSGCMGMLPISLVAMKRSTVTKLPAPC